MGMTIFKSKYFRIPVIAISIVIAIIFVCFSSVKDLVIFPNSRFYTYDYYTDEPNGGNSEVSALNISDTNIRFKFLLKDKFQSPYVGLSFSPIKNKAIIAGKYNCVSISVLGKNINRIGVSLYTPPLDIGKDTFQDEMLYHSYVNITSQQKKYQIPTSQLQHPEWWEDLHHLPEKTTDRPDLNNILHINVGSAFSQNIDEEKTIEIYQIAFTRSNQKLFMGLGLFLLSWMLLNFGILYLIALRKNKNRELVVAYKSIDIVDTLFGEEKAIDYINSNYSNNKLTLEKIAQETSIPPRRITKIINDKYNCNFKTYLNRIRINESKRHLTNPNLNIGEIAYSVGFNSQSHFNRVFKTEIQKSPSEYREDQKS